MALDAWSGPEIDIAAADELAPDTRLLNGEYRIIRSLNGGGFGIIYLARNSLGRDVVIKECFPAAICRREGSEVKPRTPESLAWLEQVRACFLNEAHMLSMLPHPNIVQLHQVFLENGTAYLALDHIAGRDLLDMLEDGAARLSQGQIVAVARKLIAAVGCIHGKGLLHCDISPDNIFVTPDVEPVLIDFGAARTQATAARRSYGGPRVVKDGYSPQEQYQPDGLLDQTSDLYALGASLYHLIAGSVPPGAQDRMAAFAAARPDPCRPLAASVPDYPRGFLESIDRAMALLPAARHRSAQDWLAALSPAQPAAERPVVLVRRAASLAPARPAAAAARQAPAGDTGCRYA